MNELIKIETQEVGENLVETVNARDLHDFLESKQAVKDFNARQGGRK